MILPASQYPGIIEAYCPVDELPLIDHDPRFTPFPRWLKTTIIHWLRGMLP